MQRSKGLLTSILLRHSIVGVKVTVDQGPQSRPLALPPRFDLAKHSPTGFDWGCGDSGAAQLALAILAHHTGDDPLALELYQQFKWRVISRLPDECWAFTSDHIAAWVADAIARRNT